MFSRLSALILSAAVALTASAVPAKKGLRAVRQADGSTIMIERVGDEHRHFLLSADGALLRHVDGQYRLADFNSEGMLVDSDHPVRFTADELSQRLLSLPVPATEMSAGRPGVQRVSAIGKYPNSSFPGLGEQRALVVLVEYTDVKFTLSDPHTYFSDLLSTRGFSTYGATGCVEEYYEEASMGNFLPKFDLYGPITLSRQRSYYGGNDPRYGQDLHPEQMIIEACQQLDSTVDFSQYDRDGDGYIDNVFVFYAGQGEASYGDDDTVWPHSADITDWGRTYRFDGKILGRYACTNEWEYNRPDGIGTFVHEFSHVLGLPDLYHTTSQATYTPGTWSVMDYGPYNNDGMTPPTFSSFERNAMGWITPVEVEPDTEITITDLRTTNQAYSLTNPLNGNEFYLLENRQQTGCDKYLPYHGMLIWHVDYNSSRWYMNQVNNSYADQGVDLVEADGRDYKNVRTGGDAFPGTAKVTRYNPKWKSGKSAGIFFSDITETTRGDITVNVKDIGESTDYMSVADVIALGTSASLPDAKVRGYIVGYVKSSSYSQANVVFSAPASIESNVVLADTPTETDYQNCIPVQLKSSSAARTDLNLRSNAGRLGAHVELYGQVTSYMSVPGMKSVSEYTLLDDNSSITDITADPASGSAEWYDVNGRRVLPTAPGLYLRRTPSGTTKHLLK